MDGVGQNRLSGRVNCRAAAYLNARCGVEGDNQPDRQDHTKDYNVAAH